MDDTAVKGWRGFKFLFGSMQQQQETPEQDIATELEHHIEELAFGGYRASHIDDADT